VNAPVALITGAATGIGATVATALAGRGFAIAACDIDAAGAQSTVDAIVATGGHGLSVALDVSDADAVRAAIDHVAATLGTPTAVLTAAGVMQVSPFLNLDPTVWERTLRINLTGTFLVLQACAAAMVRAQLPGAMVAVASVAARGPRADAADYAASKAGILSLVSSSALALAQHRIRVNAICPGVVDTAMTRRNAADRAAREGTSPEQALATLIERIPLGWAARPEEIASVALQLLGADFGYVTGQAINVCGGLVFN
jgi:NAD(P)-dependent dehydrogenase (short-subunit alcohol dehydrogenase family)